jgi:predicted Zn-dependent protease
MKRIVIQGGVIITIFFATWCLLAQIDWVTRLRIQKVTDKTEERLGKLLLDNFRKSDKEITDTLVLNSIDSIIGKICFANEINRKFIKVHVLNKDDINAFALPNGHLIIYSGLIITSKKEEELSGVICHELAHINLNHVSQKLVKEFGLSVIISMTAGSGGSDIIRKAAKVLSSSAFDRRLEKEADIKAVEYLVKAKIDPQPFAEFLYKLADKENDTPKYLTWISTHPDSKERAAYINELCRDKNSKYEKIVTSDNWIKLKENLNKAGTLLP